MDNLEELSSLKLKHDNNLNKIFKINKTFFLVMGIFSIFLISLIYFL